MAETWEIELCKKVSKEIRKDIINMTYSLRNVGAHLGGSMSMAEMLATLYCCRLKFDKSNPNWEDRDRVILSKGHAAMALYSILAQVGIIPKELLVEFKQNGSKLSGHPSLSGLPGIEYASGSLGQGLSLAVGAAIALKKRNNDKSRMFVFLGDGECDEGSIWEAAASASHFQLDNIVVIVDANAIQYDGYTSQILNMNPAKQKWIDFGWECVELDGHNVEALLDALAYKNKKPYVIIANTIKGKGVSFMEDNWQFHNSRLSESQYNLALQELEAE